jgi:hypothetical protein
VEAGKLDALADILAVETGRPDALAHILAVEAGSRDAPAHIPDVKTATLAVETGTLATPGDILAVVFRALRHLPA